VICSKCDEDKAPTEFRWRNKALGKRHGFCKTCAKKKDRRHYLSSGTRRKKIRQRQKERLAKKKIWYEELRSELKCVRCGYNKCIQALEFHHRDPNEKEAAISDIVKKDYSKERALEEMSKCDVLCANCHREEHFGYT
jgi:protein-arginine kinase activator protein McsA